MVEKIKDYDGTAKYVVRNDVDDNGVKDEITFGDFDKAKMYEDCYIKGDQDECKKFDNYLPPSPHWRENRVDIQYFTRNGAKGKICTMDSFYQLPLRNLKGSLITLSQKFSLLSPSILKEMATDLFLYFMNPSGTKNGKDLLLNYLTDLNSYGTGPRMNQKQVAIVADLIWSHKKEIKSALSLNIEPFSGDIKEQFLKKAFDLFGSCVNERDSCIDDSITLSKSELSDVSTHFYFKDCRPSSGKELQEDMMIQGIPCAKGSYVEFDEKGDLTIATLSKEHTIGNNNFKAGTQLTFAYKGHLQTAILTTDHTFSGITFSPSRPVSFSGYGNEPRSGILARDQMIGGIKYKGNTYFEYDGPSCCKGEIAEDLTIKGIQVPAGSRIVVSREELSSIQLSEKTKIFGIPFLKGDRIGITYYNGDIYSIRMRPDEPREFNGIQYAAHNDVAWYKRKESNDTWYIPDGVLASDQTIKGIKYKGGKEIRFHAVLNEEGLMTSGTVSGEQKYANIALYDGMRISIWPSSNREKVYVTLPGSIKYMGIPAAADDTALGVEGNYDNDGHPLPKYVGNITCGNSSQIQFHPDGRLRALTLSEDFTINHIKIPANSEVEFDEKGILNRIRLGGDATIFGVPLIKYDLVDIRKSNSENNINVWFYFSSSREFEGLQYQQGQVLSKEVVKEYPNDWDVSKIYR